MINTSNIAYILNRYECEVHNDTQELSELPKYVNGRIVIDGYEINGKGTHVKVTHWHDGTYTNYWLSYQGGDSVNAKVYKNEFYLPRELNG